MFKTFTLINQKLLTNFKFGLLGGLLALVGLLYYSPTSLAAEGLALSPAKAKIDIKSGQETTEAFKVLNWGDNPIKFNVSVEPYHVSSENYQQDFTEQTSRTQLSRWIQFDQTTYTLDKGGEVEVAYRVKAPANIPDGNQYAAIFVTSEASGDGAVQSQQRLGMLVHAKTDGNTVEAGKILDSEVPFWHFKTNLKAKQRIENSGNTDFEAKVGLEVKTIFGKTLFQKAEDWTIMAETTRATVTEWDKVPLFGLFKAELKVEALGETKASSHWVFFISPIVIVAILLILISIILWLGYGKKKKHRFRR